MAMAGSSLLVVILAMAVVIPFDLERMKHLNKDEAQIFIQAFNKDFARVILLNTVEEAVNLTDHLKKIPLVQNVSLIDNYQNTVFTYVREASKGGTLEEVMDVQQINQSIDYFGDNFGRVNLVISNSRLKDRIQHYTEIIVPLIIGLFMVALMFARLLYRYFSKPIIDLSTMVNDIAKSGDYSRRVESKLHDEIGLLYQGFNKMLDTVEQTQVLLAEEKEQAVFTLNSISDAVIRTDQFGNIEYINPVAERLINCNEADVIGKSVEEVISIIDGTTKAPVVNPIGHCIHENRVITSEGNQVMTFLDGSTVEIDSSASPIHNTAKEIDGAVMVFRDVSRTRALTRKLSYQATHDELTGLLNRRQFEQHLLRSHDSAKIKNDVHILCYMDLDNFKVVNDTSGHQAGDMLLEEVAHVLSSKLRVTDILARLGGDEFAVLFNSCDIRQANLIANSLRQGVEDYELIWGDKSFKIGVSIGLVEINSDSPSVEEILKQSDSACYEAKNAGRNCIRIYSP